MTLFDTLASNWPPWSEVRLRGTMNLETQVAMKVGDGVRCDVSDGGGFGPTCKTIHIGEDVAMTGRG